jgi:hypothetical protein
MIEEKLTYISKIQYQLKIVPVYKKNINELLSKK